jgi:hypothetical protein
VQLEQQGQRVADGAVVVYDQDLSHSIPQEIGGWCATICFQFKRLPGIKHSRAAHSKP